jgi:hypothetical protein
VRIAGGGGGCVESVESCVSVESHGSVFTLYLCNN